MTIGITQSDAVRGASEKRPSHTSQYGEEVSERSNKEMRRLRNSYTISIPKHLAGKDLVLVPKEEYEALQERASFAPLLNYKTVKMTKTQKLAFEKGEKNFAKGNFVTLDVLKRDLERRR